MVRVLTNLFWITNNNNKRGHKFDTKQKQVFGDFGGGKGMQKYYNYIIIISETKKYLLKYKRYIHLKSENNVYFPRISNDIFPHMNPILIPYHITLNRLDRSFFSSIFQ